MPHDEILVRLDEVIALASEVDPFSPVDLALAKLRSDINAQKLAQQAEDENIEVAFKEWQERNGYLAVCSYADY